MKGLDDLIASWEARAAAARARSLDESESHDEQQIQIGIASTWTSATNELRSTLIATAAESVADRKVRAITDAARQETERGRASRRIHEAGPLENAVQLCRRCGAVLSDYRGAMILIGDPPLTGWAIGAHVEVDGDNPRSSWVTDEAPTCEARS